MEIYTLVRKYLKLLLQKPNIFFIFAKNTKASIYDTTTLRSQHVFSTDGEAVVYIGSVTDAYLLVETTNGHQYEGWIY